MDYLIRKRPVIIAIFIFALLAMAVALIAKTNLLYIASGLTAQITFILLMLTESFGSISKQRHAAWKITARILFALTVLSILIPILFIIILELAPRS